MKKQVEWEEVETKDLFPTSSFDGGEKEYTSVFEMILEKYSERVPILRVLHTNFNLSLPILKRLSTVVGVETLLPISRYRAVVMFGKLFDIELVKKEILLEINKFLYPKELREQEEISDK